MDYVLFGKFDPVFPEDNVPEKAGNNTCGDSQNDSGPKKQLGVIVQVGKIRL